MFSLVPGASIIAFGKLITFSELSLCSVGPELSTYLLSK